MSYDPKTRAIQLKDGQGFADGSLRYFLDLTRTLALEPGAALGIREDWDAIERWLGCKGRELVEADYQRAIQGWSTYFRALPEPKPVAVQLLESELTAVESVTLPPDVAAVFKRLLKGLT